jgi:molybdopterin synthase catalytic subunit
LVRRGAKDLAVEAAIGKVRLAEREIARIELEYLAREKRIAVIEALIAAKNQVYDVWCYQLVDDMSVGQEVETIEVPGFWRDEG